MSTDGSARGDWRQRGIARSGSAGGTDTRTVGAATSPELEPIAPIPEPANDNSLPRNSRPPAPNDGRHQQGSTTRSAAPACSRMHEPQHFHNVCALHPKFVRSLRFCATIPRTRRTRCHTLSSTGLPTLLRPYRLHDRQHQRHHSSFPCCTPCHPMPPHGCLTQSPHQPNPSPPPARNNGSTPNGSRRSQLRSFIFVFPPTG